MAHSPDTRPLRELQAPARNNFFYGKMMGVFQFETEQAYGIRKRALVNRLALGTGVLCGLEVTASADGQKLLVGAGVAIDALGREIIVPAPYCVQDPRQPTDACGMPEGERIAGEGAVTLFLCYHECETEPVPVLAGDCDTRQGCASDLVRERYRLRVVAGLPAARPAGLDEAACAAIFLEAPGDDFDGRVAACETLSSGCEPPSEDCVVLATVAFGADPAAPITVDSCTYRPVVYSNSRLFDLIMCLGERAATSCCERLMLKYVSGDAQQGPPASLLAVPIVVEVIDQDGLQSANQEVTFTVRGGGGAVAPATVTTGADGRAETRWTLGPAAGLNTLAASIAAAPELPLFSLAVAEVPPPVTLPPVVMFMWPDNASIIQRSGDDALFREWVGEPRVALTFDRKMEQDQLADPDRVRQWLRIHRLLERGERVTVVQVGFDLSEIVEDFQGRPGFTAVYRLDLSDAERPSRYLVQVRATAGNITDTNTPPLTLDAEFRGTNLPREVRTEIWNLEGSRILPRSVWDGLADTGETLPKSGDGVEAGEFHGWFEILAD